MTDKGNNIPVGHKKYEITMEFSLKREDLDIIEKVIQTKAINKMV